MYDKRNETNNRKIHRINIVCSSSSGNGILEFRLKFEWGILKNPVRYIPEKISFGFDSSMGRFKDSL